MEIIRTVKEMQEVSMYLHAEHWCIGFVPTMGFLHDGHLSLIKRAKKENNVCIVSMYVNPTQFNSKEDLKTYPRNFERDEKLLRQANIDYLFYPKDKEIYPEGYQTVVQVEKLGNVLEGVSRPDHFKGVATVVTKLFNIIKPNKAYFGQKDYQQCLVIKQLVRDLTMDVQVVVCPTIREKDGLAMSSRNVRLTLEERQQAVCLYQALRHTEQRVKQGEKNTAVLKREMEELILKNTIAKIDYVEIVQPETLAPLETIKQNAMVCLAAFIGKTRLIENEMVKVK